MSDQEQQKSVQLSIHSLGGMGDGLAEYEGQTLYVPHTCPGDVVTLLPSQPKAQLLEVLTPSPQRQAAACQHFGSCGGCSLQHLNAESYAAFKQGILSKIIRQLGVDASVLRPMVQVGAGSRRRVEFKTRRNKKVFEIGFYAAKSHELVAVQDCPVTDPLLMAELPEFQQCLLRLEKPKHVKGLSLTKLDYGLDAVVMVGAPLRPSDRETLIAFAKERNYLRLSEQLEEPVILYDTGEAKISFAGVDVALPVGAFLQATKPGEEAITELVTRHLQGCKHVVDLYSGCGTYSFPLHLQSQRVTAYEGNAEMVAAMHNALTKNQLDGMKAMARDLFTHPLNTAELNLYDGIVINPPRNGALPQVKQIGKSGVGKVVMVSCNPASFKRDAKHLLDCGYRLTEAVPIDQFYWSGHLELVAVFEK